MDYNSPWVVDTSLDLNMNFRGQDEAVLREKLSIPKEVQSTGIMDFGSKVSVKEEQEMILFAEESLLLASKTSNRSCEKQDGALMEELNRATAENKKLTEILTAMCENYNTLRNQLSDYASRNREKELSPSKKRKSDSNNNIVTGCGISESSSIDEESSKKPRQDQVIDKKVSKVYVRTEANDTNLVVKDGYQWRKYGQKITRDNPCPRGYFKCSFAPSCPVKKKVQRSVEDQSILVATYEGEHNHPNLMPAETTSGATRSLNLGSLRRSTSIRSYEPTIVLDLAKSMDSNEDRSSRPRMDKQEIQQILVEQMASSLTKDPNFTAAIAAAVSGRMFQQSHTE